MSGTAAIDLAPILNPLLQVIGAVLAVALPALAGWALMIFQQRTGITVTDQQRATILGAVATSSGILMTKLAKGAKQLDTIEVNDPEVAAEANRIIAAVPAAVTALGVSPETIATMIVGKVGESIAADPTIPTVPVTTTSAATVTDQAGRQIDTAATSTTATDAASPPPPAA